MPKKKNSKKLKPSWVLTDIPLGTKIKLWRLMIDNTTYKSWEARIVGKHHMKKEDEIFADDELIFIKDSEGTYETLKKEIRCLPVAQIQRLPHDLQEWIVDVRPELKGKMQLTQQVPSESTLSPALDRHFRELAEVADAFYRVQMFRNQAHQDGDSVEVTEEIPGWFKFWIKSHVAPVPLPDISELSKMSQSQLRKLGFRRPGERMPGLDPDHHTTINYEKAGYFFEHFRQLYPELSPKEWKGLVTFGMSQKVVGTLRYLRNTASFKHCPACQVCADLSG